MKYLLWRVKVIVLLDGHLLQSPQLNHIGGWDFNKLYSLNNNSLIAQLRMEIKDVLEVTLSMGLSISRTMEVLIKNSILMTRKLKLAKRKQEFVRLEAWKLLSDAMLSKVHWWADHWQWEWMQDNGNHINQEYSQIVELRQIMQCCLSVFLPLIGKSRTHLVRFGVKMDIWEWHWEIHVEFVQWMLLGQFDR